MMKRRTFLARASAGVAALFAAPAMLTKSAAVEPSIDMSIDMSPLGSVVIVSRGDLWASALADGLTRQFEHYRDPGLRGVTLRYVGRSADRTAFHFEADRFAVVGQMDARAAFPLRVPRTLDRRSRKAMARSAIYCITKAFRSATTSAAS
jgi:hypothetical protein